MTANTSFILKTMKVIFWIIFIGLCIKAGSVLFSYIVSMGINPIASHNLDRGLNLSELYAFSLTHYSILVVMLIGLTGLKAYIGYWVVKISLELKMEKPFSKAIQNIIIKISQIAIWAGLLAAIAQAYSNWLIKKNVAIPIDWAYGEILFFAGVIYFIAQVFKKGTELQTENELTI